MTLPPQFGKVVLNHFEFPGPVVFKLDIHLKSSEDLVKTQTTTCIYKFQVITDAVGPETRLANHWLNLTLISFNEFSDAKKKTTPTGKDSNHRLQGFLCRTLAVQYLQEIPIIQNL